MLLNLQQHLFEKLNALVFKLLALLEHLFHVLHVLRGQFVQLLDGFLITFFSLKGKKGRNDKSHLTNKIPQNKHTKTHADSPHPAKKGGGATKQNVFPVTSLPLSLLPQETVPSGPLADTSPPFPGVSFGLQGYCCSRVCC